MAVYNLGALESLAGDGAGIADILQSWPTFCAHTDALLQRRSHLHHLSLPGGFEEEELLKTPFYLSVAALCRHGLASLIQDHFLQGIEETFKRNAVQKFWKNFEPYAIAPFSEEDLLDEALTKSLEEICSEKDYLENCLLVLNHSLLSFMGSTKKDKDMLEMDKATLLSRFQLIISSILLESLPQHFPVTLRLYFKRKLEELNSVMSGEDGHACELLRDERFGQQCKDTSGIGYMDIDDGCKVTNSMEDSLVRNIGNVVRDLRNLGFASMAEDAYASVIFFLLKTKVQDLAGDDYRSPVLGSIKGWMQAVPLTFLHDLLVYLGDSVQNDNASSNLESPLLSRPSCYPGIENPSDLLVRWQLRLEYLAYETLQDLRIAKLFEIIVDYPDSGPAIDDLKQCLEYTGQHAKLVDSFLSSLRYRLLTAGASTNDILHQYVSTIKAFRTIDPSGVLLEAVGEPIRDYLKGRKDTVKCIVTMLTDGSGGNPSGTENAGESLLEELNRDAESQEGAEYEDDTTADDKQAWVNAERWEPDPVDADPLKGSRKRRKIDILGMMVNIIGSKDQLVNEYRIMLAEKLLNKFDYDIDSEIRTLELLKIHFGEISMQKCEIMLNDLIDSKRTNANIKATIKQHHLQEQAGMSMENLNATIISSNFWPPIQEESLHIPSSVDQLLSDYANRFHEIKTPRKLIWKKNLGMVKLELQFMDRSIQFTVTPVHAAIVMQFQEQKSWTSENLAAAVGIPVDGLTRRINFWISKGILVESPGEESGDHVFSIVEAATDGNRNLSGHCEPDEESEREVASVEEQGRKEMTVYEKYIIGMLTNFNGLPLDRIHNMLKMFCTAEAPYDKSLQEMQSFLSDLVSAEKLEMRDGMYLLKK